MLTVDFYLLESMDDRNRLLVTCKIAAKAYLSATPTYIYTDNKAQALMMDEALWTYSDTSFIPHQLAATITENEKNALPQLLIGWETAPTTTQLIINVAQQIPELGTACTRIIEVVSKNPEQLQIARDHYRYYQTIGAQLNSHPLTH
jgi:DNA polymerase-3 subunit chi